MIYGKNDTIFKNAFNRTRRNWNGRFPALITAGLTFNRTRRNWNGRQGTSIFFKGYLLIVPEGIEIWAIQKRLSQLPNLLIVPEGIEMEDFQLLLMLD